MKHLLSVGDLDAATLGVLLDRSVELKAQRGTPSSVLSGRSVALIFEKPSTRTRVSFEVAISELGGTAIVLDAARTQMGRGETIEDTARTLSRYVHALVVRTSAQERLVKLATAGTIPVINALSDLEHPCQALADLMTIREHLGKLHGVTLAFVGDGNNVAHSLMLAGALSGVAVRCVTPKGFAPDAAILDQAVRMAAANGGPAPVATSDLEAVAGADVVYTDVWASMGREEEASARAKAFEGFTLDDNLLRKAGDPLVMHCLPAHRGEEITASVFEGSRSIVWDQAENRLHTQKAVLEALLT